MKYSENPFVFGKVAKGRAFFNRKIEKDELTRDIYNHQNVIIYAPRRYGKTSLVFKVFEDIKRTKKDFAALYIDFYNVNSIEDFLALMSSEYARNSGLSLEKILTSIRNLVRGVTPSLSIDESGKPKIEISVSPKTFEHTFDDVMKLPEKLSEEGKITAVFFDEFQESVALNGFEFQKKLRSVIQHQSGVSYIFCGSKQHLFQNIFSDFNNPLFKIGTVRYLHSIPEKEFIKFIFNRFIKLRKDFTREFAKEICALAGDVPYNIQSLCYHIYDEVLIRENEPLEKLIRNGYEKIIEHKSEEFLFIYDSLSVSARRALEIIINTGGKNLFTKNILSEYMMPASTLKKAITVLIEKGIIFSENRTYLFQDEFFKAWLKRKQR